VPGDRDSAGDHYQRPAGAGGATLYKNVENGKLDVAGYIEQFKNILPPYFQHLLDRFGMGNLEGLREKIVKSAMQGSQFFATQAFSFGQGTFDFW
jgi:hypothetical protein